MSKIFKPRLKLVCGEWYAFAPNNSKKSKAALVAAIGAVRSWNVQRRAAMRSKNMKGGV